MDQLALRFYRSLLALSALAMVSALLAVSLGIVARLARWNIPGLDAYAGYAIAASLFFALPATLVQGEHIRVTLVLERLGAKAQAVLEWVSLACGVGLSVYLAWFSLRLVWVSYSTHDISTAADASPLWIPQLAMGLGCVGLALAFVHAAIRALQGTPLIAATSQGNTE